MIGIDNITKEIFVEASKKIQYEDKDIIESYFVNKPFDIRNYQYYNNYFYNHLMNNKSYKYVILDLKEDKVLVLFKDIKIFQTKYLRLLSFPLSLNNISENENNVFDKLQKAEIFKEMYCPEITSNRLSGFAEYTDENYYTDISEEFDRVNKGSYKSKNRINISKNNIVFKSADMSDLDNIKELIEYWKVYKTKEFRSKTMFKEFIKNYNRYISDKNCEIYVMYYDNQLINVAMFCKMYEDNYYQVINISKNHTNYANSGITDELFNKTIKNVAKIFLYYYVNEFNKKGVKNVFYAGAGGSTELKNYKDNMYKNHIKYHTIDLKEEGVGL